MFWNNTEYPALATTTAETYFTVGVNNEMTVLKIHNDNHTTTLTMSSDTTQLLIRLLATAIDSAKE